MYIFKLKQLPQFGFMINFQLFSKYVYKTSKYSYTKILVHLQYTTNVVEYNLVERNRKENSKFSLCQFIV